VKIVAGGFLQYKRFRECEIASLSVSHLKVSVKNKVLSRALRPMGRR